MVQWLRNVGFDLHSIKTVSRKKLKSQQCECLFLIPYLCPHHLHEFHIFLLLLKDFRPAGESGRLPKIPYDQHR